jgi:hypothetical protein
MNPEEVRFHLLGFDSESTIQEPLLIRVQAEVPLEIAQATVEPKLRSDLVVLNLGFREDWTQLGVTQVGLARDPQGEFCHSGRGLRSE